MKDDSKSKAVPTGRVLVRLSLDPKIHKDVIEYWNLFSKPMKIEVFLAAMRMYRQEGLAKEHGAANAAASGGIGNIFDIK